MDSGGDGSETEREEKNGKANSVAVLSISIFRQSGHVFFYFIGFVAPILLLTDCCWRPVGEDVRSSKGREMWPEMAQTGSK